MQRSIFIAALVALCGLSGCATTAPTDPGALDVELRYGDFPCPGDATGMASLLVARPCPAFLDRAERIQTRVGLPGARHVDTPTATLDISVEPALTRATATLEIAFSYSTEDGSRSTTSRLDVPYDHWTLVSASLDHGTQSKMKYIRSEALFVRIRPAE